MKSSGHRCQEKPPAVRTDIGHTQGDGAFLIAALGLFWFVAVGLHILGLGFVGDDYIFLDRTRGASFGELWSPANSMTLGWYRPWAREVHFWLLQNIFGINPAAFRLVNGALWIVALSLYASVVRIL